MTYHQFPKQQGLYRPEFEKDACGIGLYAHIKGHASHDIVTKGLQMLRRLDHRGGQGSDPLTGDGAGIMVQIPDAYFRRVCEDLNLPPKGQYGVGMIFFSNNKVEQQEIEQQLQQLIEQEGQILIGWRTVPVRKEEIGIVAQQSCPVIRQVFIKANTNMTDPLAFERKLYIIRKLAENWARKNKKAFYFASLSSRTIVYKGLLTSEQVGSFYVDLNDPDFVSPFSLVHSRFSTNTFPSWERAHPNRYLIHNGEINTLRGNLNWMKARESQFVSKAFGEDLSKVLPILDENGSDSAVLDNALEFLVLAGRKPAQAAMILIPEPWSDNPYLSEEKKAFYEFHSSLMEPWDGPMAVVFTDGKQIGAVLDRNGLRPARYYVTKDDYLIFASEVGAVDVEEENILYKERLRPGKMLLLDLEEGRLISDEEIKEEIVREKPYQQWLAEHKVQLPADSGDVEMDNRFDDLITRQKAFGYTYENIHKYFVPVVTEGEDPIGSMGNDSPLAVLSDFPQSLFNYFKQTFAQVTNPPIDALREQLVTSTLSWLGAEGNLLHPKPTSCHRIQLNTPILSDHQMTKLKNMQSPSFLSKTIDILFYRDLEGSLESMFEQAKQAIHDGVSLLILSDRKMNQEQAVMPVLLAASGLNQYLIRQGLRSKVSIIVEAGEPREVHHFATLIGYGVDAIYPYLAYATYRKLIDEGHLAVSYRDAVNKYIQVITKGIVKVMSKMGISTIQSYRGAQIFESIGLSQKVIDQFFTGTASQIDGIGLDVIEQETLRRHQAAYASTMDTTLDSGSEFQWRDNGEYHAFNPSTIHTLQWACRKKDYALFKKYSQLVNEERIGFLRNLFSFKKDMPSIPIEEVESVESIVKRFKTGAMSFGSISKEAHEALAIAMNRLGGRSNCGEGGEHPQRFVADENGDNRCSAIKQVASARFGVTSHYLVNANELQIKMAQGAKPGEGGQLPGKKVYPWVAEVRRSTPGVSLISPPPHHDIYSIEDLAQLIYDLKNANRHARISVKLVAKAGVGTIAAGVAKGSADVIVISGYDGGTGASPKTSIKHTGIPWELGLAEAHQTLMLNGLRDRVVLETDGKLMTGRDVVLAALLGAEEFGFATAPLVVLGCVMMRACHLDTCPVGVATQNPELRYKFAGNPDHIVNFMEFIAQEVRELMAELGFRTIDEMVGRTDVLTISGRAKSHWKAKHLDLSRLLYQPEGIRICQNEQNHKIAESLDYCQILPQVKNAIQQQRKVQLSLPIKNTNRAVGTIVGSEISKIHGEEGLPEDTITLLFHGSAGQSFGAFAPKGITFHLTGDANDYLGKGLSGAKMVVAAPTNDPTTSEQIIVGNVAFYGATSGEAYINGSAGERFAVRNSGAQIVVEGVGDHGCEYMTGGKVVVLGKIGKNFAAGMSGGVAYVLAQEPAEFKFLCNTELIQFETLCDQQEIGQLKQMIYHHYLYTQSARAASLLKNWEQSVKQFIKVIPRDYKQMLERIAQHTQAGCSREEAEFRAFYESVNQEAVVSTKLAVTT